MSFVEFPILFLVSNCYFCVHLVDGSTLPAITSNKAREPLVLNEHSIPSGNAQMSQQPTNLETKSFLPIRATLFSLDFSTQRQCANEP